MDRNYLSLTELADDYRPARPAVVKYCHPMPGRASGARRVAKTVTVTREPDVQA